MRQHFLAETVTQLKLLAIVMEAKLSFSRGNNQKALEPFWGISDNGATIPIGRTAITLKTPTVPYRPRASSVQVLSMIGACGCA